MLGVSGFPAEALWKSNMKMFLRQMVVGTSLEPLARKVHAAFTRQPGAARFAFEKAGFRRTQAGTDGMVLHNSKVTSEIAP